MITTILTLTLCHPVVQSEGSKNGRDLVSLMTLLVYLIYSLTYIDSFQEEYTCSSLGVCFGI
jgi:hypothetical protein